MSNELNRIDGPEDSEKPERRRTPLALIIALIAVCAMLGAFGVFASGVLNSDNPTEEPPTDEPLISTATETFTPVPTEEPTEPPTDEPTDTPTPTAEPTDEPTAEPTDEPTEPPPPPQPGCVCGDSVCCGGEATSCPADCGGDDGPCANNGGLQWQGEVCICPGVIDIVTFCQDGSKSDVVTDRTCQPTQDCAPPPECVPGTYVCACSGFYVETCRDTCTGAWFTRSNWSCFGP